MAKIDIELAFNTENRSVYTYMSQPGQGLYIPLYQREYSWDDDNITQLLEDINKGVLRIVVDNSEDEIRFLGTVITVKESNKANLHPVDLQAVPPSVEKIIDGQQRLSTIAILAGLMCKYFDNILRKCKIKNPIHEPVKELCDYWKTRLLDILSVDLRRGTPKYKPKIIRGSIDYWTKEKAISEAYRSPIARFLGDTISAIIDPNNTAYPTPKKEVIGRRLTGNIKTMESWLKNTVLIAHMEQNDDFPPAWEILKKFQPEEIVAYEHTNEEFNIEEIINGKDFSSQKTDSYILCELIQLAAVCHYLLDRCCFTIIQPTNDDWAFDMFQSLNATGTPLTAIETFKPLVVNDKNADGGYKGSEIESSMEKVENLFSSALSASAQQKSKLTNEFLTSFYVAYNGSSLSSHFSHQRRMLIESYRTRETSDKKASFINFFGQYAEFYNNMWLNNTFIESNRHIAETKDHELATLLISFLKESNHKMAIPVLSTFYRDILDKKDNAAEIFVAAVKATAAFYIFWRSAGSNAGLDNVYREFFKSDDKSWKYENSVSIDNLKSYYIKALKEKHKIEANEESWKQSASVHLRYDETTTICRLLLFFAFHDTILDETPENIGLMKPGRHGTDKYLSLEKWNNQCLSTIEHIAPQSNNDSWDKKIYDIEKPLMHSVGNLTLLSQDLNSSAGNKSWAEKCLYYKCVSKESTEVLNQIEAEALEHGISLNRNTIDLLKQALYSSHLKPIIHMYEKNINWDALFIQKRTERILGIAWTYLKNWLYE